MTVGELRKLLESVPDDYLVVREDHDGTTYDEVLEVRPEKPIPKNIEQRGFLVIN